MPRKKKGHGFYKQKNKGQHLRRGYIHKRNPEAVVQDQQDGSPLSVDTDRIREKTPELENADQQDSYKQPVIDYETPIKGTVDTCDIDMYESQVAVSSTGNNQQGNKQLRMEVETSDAESSRSPSNESNNDTTGNTSDDGSMNADFDDARHLDNPSTMEHVEPPPCMEDACTDVRNEQSQRKTDESSNKLLQEASRDVGMFLPPHWTCAVINGKLALGFVAVDVPFTIQRSISVTPAGEVQIFVHNKLLPAEHKLWNSVKNIRLLPSTIRQFGQSILDVANSIRPYAICGGTKDFEPAWKSCELGFVDDNQFLETRYTRTFRSHKCLYLVDNLSMKRCKECTTVGTILRKRADRKQNQSVRTPPVKKPDKYLNTPQRFKRAERNRRTIRNLKEQNDRLRQKVRKVLHVDGVDIDHELSEDFSDILNDPENNSKLTPLQKLFVEQQIQASRLKNTRSMRWHPMMVRLAIQIKASSSAAYEDLRKVLHLPSERTLYDYTHYVEVAEGCHSDLLDMVGEKVKACKHPYQAFHVLCFDEMTIRQNLVYRKSDGALVGYIKLNEAQKEYDLLEKMLSDQVQGITTATSMEPPVATKMLTYMVNGVSNSIKDVVASYPGGTDKKEDLYYKTWEVITALEMRDVAVISLVCNGAAVNRAFIQMHAPLTKTKSGVVFDTINLAAPERPIFFLSDPPHLLKTSRNCLYSSGHVRKNSKNPVRLMTKNKQTMTWSTIKRLYNDTLTDTLRKVYKLNANAVYLTSYSVMRVPLAENVMNREVADLIRQKNWDDCEELAIYLENVHDMFRMLNGAHTSHAIRTRDPLLQEYREIDDPRFDKLSGILQYFQEWEEEVQKLPLTPGEKAKRLPSRETLQGIEMTIRGFSGAVKFLLNEGTNFINARVFSQDCLEHYFSRQRSSQGGNRHPDVSTFLENDRSIRVQSDLALVGRRKGNCAVRAPTNEGDFNAELPKKKRVRKALELPTD